MAVVSFSAMTSRINKQSFIFPCISSCPISLPSQNRFFFNKTVRMTKISYSNRFSALNMRCNVVTGDFVQDGMGCPMASGLSTLELSKTSTINKSTKERGNIVVIGLNVHTSPVEMREKLAIPEEKWRDAVEELCALNHITEAAILSTCNRIEIYVVALSQDRGVKEVTQWMSKISGVTVSELCAHRFVKHNQDAIRHLFQVSSGLDSLVLGEGQILGQVKQVVRYGEGVSGFGRKISGLFKQAITVGKRVRTDTDIGTGSVSISAAAVDLGLQKLPEPSYLNYKVLVVGAGKMGKLVIKHLVSKGCKKIVIANRTEEKVKAIRDEFKDVEITYKPLSELPMCISVSTVIFTSTASETPLIFKEDVENLPGIRNFIDISVPRNVDSRVSELDHARVYNVDDLKEVVEANKEARMRKAMEAENIIEAEVKECESRMDSLETVPTIKKLRSYAEKIRADELEKCMSKMGEELSKKQKSAIYDLSIGIMNKLVQGPMEHLKCKGSENRNLNEILENEGVLNRVFGLHSEFEEKVQ